MAENTLRSRGRPQGYKFDRGGVPAEFGPYVGIVVNNVDDTRSGRLQVWIAEFGATKADGTPDLTDTTLWRTVSYCPPFYGATPFNGTSAGAGTYPGNRNSYGMWFTPPDVGTQVLCFFVGGDPSQGYYVGCIPEPGLTHMIPAIGSSNKYVPGNNSQGQYLANAPLLPVTEINEANPAINENPRFFDEPKPVQGVVAGILFQQGLDKDPTRGPIRSNSQRESPSAVYGISTPGTAIYQGGLKPSNIRSQLEKGQVTPEAVRVIGRMGGHTFVMDDGDIDGKDQLIRIRTSKGHQITMSDNDDCFYIIHANGQTWLEFGKEGTVDVFSTNSVNVRTKGTINLHADEDINLNAGGEVNIKSAKRMSLESETTMQISSALNLNIYGKATVGIGSAGTLALNSKLGSWGAGGALNLQGLVINLNGAPTVPVQPSTPIPTYQLADTTFAQSQGWTVTPGALKTIVTRAPTHEPYPYHNKGTMPKQKTSLVSTVTSVAAGVSGAATGLQSQAASAFTKVSSLPVANGLNLQTFASQIPSTSSFGLNINSVQSLVPTSVSTVGGFNIQGVLSSPTGGFNIGSLTSGITGTIGNVVGSVTSGISGAVSGVIGNATSFTSNYVTGLMAQARSAVTGSFGTGFDTNGNLLPGWVAKAANQAVYTGVNLATRGIGLYAQNAAALVVNGFLKPGTLNLITTPSMLSTVLSNNSVWTGKQGVESFMDYLDSPQIQTTVQQDTLAGAWQGLIDQGVITGEEPVKYQATFVQPAAQYGVDAVVAWLQGQADDATTTNIEIAARQGQFAVDFVDVYSAEVLLGSELGGFENTIDRADIDQAVSDIVGNPKIPEIVFANVTPAGGAVVANVAADVQSTFRFAPDKPKE